MKSLKRLGFKNLGIRAKLFLLVGTLIAVLLVVATSIVRTQYEELQRVQTEQEGIAYLEVLSPLYRDLLEHRYLAVQVKRGDSSGAQSTLAEKIDRDLERLAEANQRWGAELDPELFEAVASDWNIVQRRFAALSADQIFDVHNRLIVDTADLYRHVAQRSGLYTRPGLPDFLDAASTSEILVLADTVSQVTTIDDAGLDSSALVLIAQTEALLGGLRRNLGLFLAESSDEDLKARGNPILRVVDESTGEFLGAVKSDSSATTDGLVDDEAESSTPVSVASLGSTSISAVVDVLDFDVSSMKARVDTRSAALNRQVVYVALLLAFGVLGGTALAAMMVRGMTRQTYEITRVLSRIGVGDFGVRAEVLGGDELGVVARAMNGMLDNTLHLIQSNEERRKQQDALTQLMEDVAGVAEGDLRREASVTDAYTGAIADAFNFMLSELRGIIGSVQSTSAQVSTSAGSVVTTAEQLKDGAEFQRERVTETSVAIRGMADSIQQVSATASSATDVASEALENANEGSAAVNETVQGMFAIRQQVQETSRRVKRLGETSQEIGEIVQLIGDIADRTGILALNASIQASMAGEAGHGFAVVAEEVEGLAERSTAATKRIAALIGAIQSETQEASASMENTIQQVVSGSERAQRAGQALQSIQTVSDRLAEFIHQISKEAEQQASGSSAIASAMGEILVVTEETASGTKEAAKSIRSLATLSEHLRDSVGHFKLPEDESSADDAGKSSDELESQVATV